MKRLIFCFMAMLGVVGMTAQSVYENEVINNIMARRSVRQYLDKPVEHELLEVVVRAGINAPSGMNRQPWIVRVVEDQQLIAEVNQVFMLENPEVKFATRPISSASALPPRVGENWMPVYWVRT